MQWNCIGPNGASLDDFVQAPSDPDRLYALPHRLGVHRSDDRGESWYRVDTDLPLDSWYAALAVSPVDKDLLIIPLRLGDHVLRSTDGGRTWTQHAASSGWGEIRSIEFDPHEGSLVLVAAEGGADPGIHRSTDGGLTWAPANTGLPAFDPEDVAFHPGTPGVVLAATGDGISRSTDGGQTWSSAATGGVDDVRSISFSRDFPSRAWAAAPGGVLRSDDGGASFWSLADCDGVCSGLAVAAHPVDPGLVLVGQQWLECTGFDCRQTVHMRRSADGGQSWSSPQLPVDWTTTQSFASVGFDATVHATAYLALRCFAQFQERDGLYRSTDAGATWSEWMNGIRGTRVLGVATDSAGAVYVRTEHRDGLFVAESLGAPWTSTDDPVGVWSEVAAFEVSRSVPGLVHDAGSSTGGTDIASGWCRRSTDGGQTFVDVPIPQASLIVAPSLVVTSHDGQTLYVWSPPDSHLFRSDDGGVSFTILVAPFGAAASVVSPADPHRLFAVDGSHTRAGVALSTDGGVTWINRSAGLPVDRGVELLMEIDDPDHMLVVFRTAGVYETTDAGVTWSAVPLALGPSTIAAADWDPDTGEFFAVSDDGVYASSLGYLNDGLPTRDLTDVHWIPGTRTLLVGTDHASVLSTVLPASVPVTAPHVASRDLPSLRAIPMPFDSSVRLELFQPRPGEDAEIALFGVDGRRVATLFRGASSSGWRSVSWDGRTDDGGDAATGVYFARARLGEETVSLRIVRVRGR